MIMGVLLGRHVNLSTLIEPNGYYEVMLLVVVVVVVVFPVVVVEYKLIE